MSALEQIRKRPGLVISILGLALLLFLFTGIDRIGDLFIDRDSAVKVDGEKIKISALQDKAQQLEKQQNSEDSAKLEEQVAQQMINDILLQNECERLGIVVTDNELAELFFGSNPNPYFTNQAQQYGFESVVELYNFAYSGQAGSEQAKAIFNDMRDNARKELSNAKFNSLLGALTVNKLDAKAYYDDNATTANVTIAKKDYSTLADTDFQISDDELKARYNRDKQAYKIPTEQRLIDYILVDVTPSQADYAAAQAEVTQAIEGLRAQASTEAIAGNFNFEATTLVGRRDALNDPTIKNNLDDIVNDGVRIISFNNDTYTIAKLLDSYVTTDSIYCDMAVIAPDANADSVLNLLNNGTLPTSLTNEVLNSKDNVGFSLVDPLNAPYKDELLNATPGKYFIIAADKAQEGQPLNAVRVARVPAQAQVYEVAKITRKVEPSSQTYNKLSEDLRTYIAKNTTSQAFLDNAAAAGFNAQQLLVSPSNLSVRGLNNSAPAARWAMEAKKGEISEVFSDPTKTYLLAMVVDQIFDGGYLTLNNPETRDAITTKLRAEKKGAKLVAQYKGQASNIEGYAAKMGVQPETVDVNFGQNYVRGFMPGDAEFLANVATAKKGTIVGPIATENSVVVLKVNSTENHGREFNFDSDKTAAMGNDLRPLQQNLFNILRENKKIKYSMQRFFGN
jgi:peptidyl-prolyl cis-trans isomerase D